MNEAKQAYWLEQSEADVPAVSQWLSAEESARLAGMRFHKRWAEWRLGRWTAKRAVAWWLSLSDDIRSLQDVEIRAAPSGAPEVFLFNERVPVSLSLSHRAGQALCVVASSEVIIGCDLELVEVRDDSFVTDFFTTNEQTLLDRARVDERAALATLLWSAKESALKALHVGLRVATTLVDVSPNMPSRLAEKDRWSLLSARCLDGRILQGWWRCSDDMVRTLVVSPLQ